MKKNKSLLAGFMAFFALAASVLAGGEGWVNDLDTALAQGKSENKVVLAEFTGSDWCPPCIMMGKKVFSKKEFVEAAKAENIILAYVDSPQGDTKVREANEKYFAKHKIEGVPTVIVFDKDGKEKERFIATEYPSLETFVAKLKTISKS